MAPTIDFTEERPLTGEEIIIAVRRQARRLGLHNHYMYDDIVAEACARMVTINDGACKIGYRFAHARYCVIEGYRSSLKSRRKHKLTFAAYNNDLIAAHEKKNGADVLAYAVIRLQNVALPPRYAELAVRLINGESMLSAAENVFGKSTPKNAYKRCEILRGYVNNGGVRGGSLNALDETKLPRSVIQSLKRIRMEKD